MKRVAPALQDAFSFLTILPLGSARLEGEEARRRLGLAMVWFPLVGAAIGAAGGAVAWSALSVWSGGVSVLLGLIAVLLLTGGLHIDGFCDSADGLAAWKGPEETLKIMRDSRIGAIGAAALFLLLALQWSLLESIPSDRLLRVWIAAGAIGRCVIVWSAQSVPYVPGQSGLGRLVTDRKPESVAWATVLGAAIALCALGWFHGTAAFAAAWGVTCVLNGIFRARLGGITGDTMGAVCVAAETTVLLAAASR